MHPWRASSTWQRIARAAARRRSRIVRDYPFGMLPPYRCVADNDVVCTQWRSDLAADLAPVLPTGRDGERVTLIAYADRDEKVRLPIIDDELIIGITTACLRASYAAPGCLCAPIAMTEQPVPIFKMKNVGASAVPMWIR